MDRHAAMRIFVKVAELRSFTQAARQLAIPRATATNAVQELEEVLQARLLNRTTRTVELTTEGATYLERCKSVLGEIDEMESMFQTGSAQLRGKIRVDMVSSLARDVVIPQLPAFFAKHPEVEVEIVGSDRRLDLVRNGIDCAIRGGPVEAGLAAIELDWGEVKTVNVVSPSYIARYGRPASLRDLPRHLLVHYARYPGEPPEGFEYFDGTKTHHIEMKGLVTVASIDAYKAACVAGLGICQNPWIGVRQLLKDGALVEVLRKFRPASGRNGKIVYPKRRHLPKRVRAFIDWIEPVLRRYFTAQDPP